MKTAVILISGRGSNMQVLAEAGLPLQVTAVISNRPDARGLAIAREHGIRTVVVDHRLYAERDAFDAALAGEIDALRPDLVLLAGFMRVLGGRFVARYAGRLLNIHPSLLPAFPGLHTHRRALAEGVRIHGCTVHFVTTSLDHGPIIIQAAVPVFDDDTEETLAARVLREEHIIYPLAVRWYVEGKVNLLPDGRVCVCDSCRIETALVSPAEIRTDRVSIGVKV
jgi:phosphoribosylglycinamide formyltransferase 1